MKTIWEEKTLESICEVFADGDWIESKDQSDSGIRLIQTGNIGFGFFKDKEDKSRFISQETFNRLKCSEIFPGDILVSRLPDPVGKSCIIPDINGLMITGVDCTIIRLKSFVISEYVRYYQMSRKYLNDVQKNVSGATRQRISRKKLGIILIPIPPLPEQQRIVAILDEAFAAIDKAKANAEKNLKNAKELFESYLQGVFENKGDGWSTKQLKDVCRLITCGVAATPKYVDAKEGVPFLSAQNVKDGNVVLDKYRYISKQFHQELTKKNKPQKGDILYSRVGSKFGEAGVVEHDFEFSVYVSLTLIKPAVEILSSYYLKHFLNSRQIKDLALKSVSSSGVPNLNVKDVREFPIMLPSIFQQDKIVENIELLSLETKRLESIYQQKLTDLEELKKSILQKAFNGELNTADLCV